MTEAIRSVKVKCMACGKEIEFSEEWYLRNRSPTSIVTCSNDCLLKMIRGEVPEHE